MGTVFGVAHWELRFEAARASSPSKTRAAFAQIITFTCIVFYQVCLFYFTTRRRSQIEHEVQRPIVRYIHRGTYASGDEVHWSNEPRISHCFTKEANAQYDGQTWNHNSVRYVSFNEQQILLTKNLSWMIGFCRLNPMKTWNGWARRTNFQC